jgi:hypothetical protein
MLVIPVILDTYSSLKDRSLKLVFFSNEPSPDQLVQIAQSIQKAGFLAFSSDAFKTEQLETLKNIKADYVETGKTQSQRLYNTLFRLWEQQPEGYTIFEDFYKAKMEVLINHFKGKLI